MRHDKSNASDSSKKSFSARPGFRFVFHHLDTNDRTLPRLMELRDVHHLDVNNRMRHDRSNAPDSHKKSLPARPGTSLSDRTGMSTLSMN